MPGRKDAIHHSDRWKTRIGLILAMAGNAIGLGNFLRFPVQAAQNGGGAFMIPYFIALILIGIPLMWVEWSIGRYGGGFGHRTAPGIFSKLWNHQFSRYLGILGILLPSVVGIYYLYIESWCLGFAWYSLTGKYFGATTRESMGSFLSGYQGVVTNEYFTSLLPALIFFILSLGLNIIILYRGVSRGIEKFARFGMPLLLVMAVFLVVRALTIGTPNPAEHPDWNITAGLAFIWNPQLDKLIDGKIWLAAAGQVFFTLSLGFGAIATYASYLRKDDDILLNGLSTAATNEFAEVILGSTIAIPIAVAFFGVTETMLIAKGGAFNLGFLSLPVIFQKIPFGQLVGFVWFFLLFMAAVTSSVALFQPVIAFLAEELHMPRKRVVALVAGSVFVLCLPVILFLKYGFLDEWDYWVGTFGLVLFASIEIILFAWVFGIDKGWEEMHQGGEIRLPKVFYYIIKYVTPSILLFILGYWFATDAVDIITLKGADPEQVPYRWAARLIVLGLIILLTILVRTKHRKEE